MKTCIHAKPLHLNAYSSSVSNFQKLETTQISLDGQADTQTVVRSYSGILHNMKKEKTIDTFNNVDGPHQNHGKDRSQKIPFT